MKSLGHLSIKTYMAGLLIILAVIGVRQQGYENVIAQLGTAPVAAILAELFIMRLKSIKINSFPSSAFITGMIIALVFSPNTPWYIAALAALIAIVQKHIIHYKGRHIFNPANFGLLSVIFISSSYPTWWGQSYISMPLLIIAGLFISYRMKRIRLPIVFTVSFLILFIVNNLLMHLPVYHAFFMLNIFFIFVMLIEPKTIPSSKKGIIIYGIAAASFSLVFLGVLPQYDFSVLALACANALAPFLNKIK